MNNINKRKLGLIESRVPICVIRLKKAVLISDFYIRVYERRVSICVFNKVCLIGFYLSFFRFRSLPTFFELGQQPGQPVFRLDKVFRVCLRLILYSAYAAYDD